LRYAPWPSPPSSNRFDRGSSTRPQPSANARVQTSAFQPAFRPPHPPARAFACHNDGGFVYTRGEALHNAYRRVDGWRRVGGMWSDEGERWKGTFYGRDSMNLVVNSSDRGSFAVFYGLRLEGWPPVARGWYNRYCLDIGSVGAASAVLTFARCILPKWRVRRILVNVSENHRVDNALLECGNDIDAERRDAER